VVPDTELGAVHVRPDGEEPETVNVTVPLKPLRFVMVMVEVAVLLAGTGDGVTAPADMPKSTMWKTMLPVVCETGVAPIVEAPVTVTV
jgi:hypothetical protein